MANLSEAIRKALEIHGVETRKETTEEIKNWIKVNYPDLTDKVGSTTFASTLSSLRKKLKEGGGSSDTAAPAPPVPPPAKTVSRSPRSAVLEAKPTTAPVEDVAAVLEAIDALKEMVRRFGEENVQRMLNSI